jgi:hypothetical protein
MVKILGKLINLDTPHEIPQINTSHKNYIYTGNKRDG